MKKLLLAAGASAGLVSTLLVLGKLRAEQVFHYGQMVANEAASEVCLTCHDGAIAKSISACTSAYCRFDDSHPIKREYPPPGREREFRPLFLVQAEGVRLPDDKVECISCHNLANPEKFHLTVEIRRSRLCLTCHIK